MWMVGFGSQTFRTVRYLGPITLHGTFWAMLLLLSMDRLQTCRATWSRSSLATHAKYSIACKLLRLYHDLSCDNLTSFSISIITMSFFKCIRYSLHGHVLRLFGRRLRHRPHFLSHLTGVFFILITRIRSRIFIINIPLYGTAGT
ncbi:hypothetical protein BKA63DRAFT_521274 [Paraphoma chrysanthemicola]|nr:hypothetical protein BKA63DRAFT_521274 [Paraphoma chrysanthemicola]